MKVRRFPENNYHAVYDDTTNTTIRSQIKMSEPITRLAYPEIVDISLGTKCFGKCPYCYADASSDGVNYVDIVDKVNKYFGDMSNNDRPFQVAIGGEGEPTIHPEFIEILKRFRELNIVPNYTTNGMHLSDELMAATKNYCGGVAVSFHPHLKITSKETYALYAAKRFLANNIRTNIHFVAGNKNDVDMLIALLFKLQSEKMNYDYVVVLPKVATGRASKDKDFYDMDLHCYFSGRLFKAINDFGFDLSKLAFGAMMYPFLQDLNVFGVHMYEPEIVSGYLRLDGDMIMMGSSFNPVPLER